MSGLLWLLVVFEGQESESESLAGLTEINTSLLMTAGFSWGDSSSSAGTQSIKKGRQSGGYDWNDSGTLTLDVRDIQSLLQPEDHHTKQQVEGIAAIKPNKDVWLN